MGAGGVGTDDVGVQFFDDIATLRATATEVVDALGVMCCENVACQRTAYEAGVLRLLHQLLLPENDDATACAASNTLSDITNTEVVGMADVARQVGAAPPPPFPPTPKRETAHVKSLT